MNFTVVETSLNRAEFRWKWLKFLQHTFLLGVALCALALLFGGAILLGWVTYKGLAVAFFMLLGVVGFIAWALIIISVMTGTPDRGWLAAAVERVDRRLMDRLNTLLFLEHRTRDKNAHSFARRIARQTHALVTAKPSPSPFSPERTLQCFMAFVAAVSLTYALYHFYSPWSRLLAAEKLKAAELVHPEKPLDLAPPPTNNIEQQQSW